MKNFVLLIALMTFAWETSLAQQDSSGPVVDGPVYFDISPPLRDLVNRAPGKFDGSWKDGIVKNYIGDRPVSNTTGDNGMISDPGLQDYFGTLVPDTTIRNFDGVGCVNNAVPPDTHGEIGSTCYFQCVNLSYAVYNKNGEKIFGPKANNTVWTGMTNNSNDGDAIVLYDEDADRWLFSQFSLPNYPSGPFYQMIAISQTNDPTGSWYRYQYMFTEMPDYPKFGIWPGGYFMSANRYLSGSYKGAGAYAYDRAAMLAGSPTATRISFTLPSSSPAYSLLPADCDGTFPPDGTPEWFVYVNQQPGNQSLGIYELTPDWSNPQASTFGNFISLPVNSFTSLTQGISQPGTSRKLNTLGDRLMYKLQYRKFNGYASMVVNHSVNTGSNVSGIRWYELRNTGTGWSIYQQSTYAPGDGHSRWMGSMAQDTAGNMALGFSISSTTLYPGIRYIGRLKNDPLNQMTVAEKTIIDGAGSQTGGNSPGQTEGRWGDYSGMSVDPYNPTTFWFTTEYYQTTSGANWATRIASFTLANILSSNASVYPGTICTGDSVQLEDVAYGGSGNYTYSWSSIPAGFTSSSRTPKTAPADTTRYICTVSDGVSVRHDTTTANVVPNPSVYAGPDSLVCRSVNKITLHGQASNYRMIGWSTSGDGTFGNTSSPVTEYTFGQNDKLNGSVTLKLIGIPLLPCTANTVSMRVITLDPCNGIGEQAGAGLKLTMQPNPANDAVTFSLTGLRNESTEVKLTSLDGHMVYSHVMEHPGDRAILNVDLTGFAKGIYIVRVLTDTRETVSRLVKQ